jgi:hypothetical protein
MFKSWHITKKWLGVFTLWQVTEVLWRVHIVVGYIEAARVCSYYGRLQSDRVHSFCGRLNRGG